MTYIKEFTVTGMSCGHCEDSVREEVSELEGVADIAVSAETGALAVTLENDSQTTDEAIIAAVDEAGYQAVTRSGMS